MRYMYKSMMLLKNKFIMSNACKFFLLSEFNSAIWK
jgi:hypothetical protein